MLLDRIRGDECPFELDIQEVPFWVQMHDLQLRAMNRGVREEISALLCRVTEVGG